MKELEKLIQNLEVQKNTTPTNNGFSPLFSNFFSFPQYSTSRGNNSPEIEPVVAGSNSAMADIEVTMVESHANLRILSKKRPRQLLKMVAGLQCLRLTILHLNVTTVDQMVLYTLSVKVSNTFVSFCLGYFKIGAAVLVKNFNFLFFLFWLIKISTF